MTLYHFIRLDEMEQQEALWEGTHIGTRYDEEHNILLYQIDGFYVEVFYHRNLNVIRRYRPFKSVDQLKPYLRQIDISELK
jgi:hypothetical protein